MHAKFQKFIHYPISSRIDGNSFCLQEKQEKEEKEILDELAEEKAEGEIVEVTNEKTGVVHRYNTKTMRDQFGSLPVWKRPRNTERKQRKKIHAQKKQFKQAWLNKFVPI